MQGPRLYRIPSLSSFPLFCLAPKHPVLVSSSLRQGLSPYPVPVEASRDGFCRDDLDEGQMLILGKDQ